MATRNSYRSACTHVLLSLLPRYRAARQHVCSAMGLQQQLSSWSATEVILPSSNNNLHRVLFDCASHCKNHSVYTNSP